MNTSLDSKGRSGGGAIFTGGWALVLGALLALTVATQAASRPDLSRLVVVGDSLLAGFRNGGLVDVYQREGIAADVALQARTPLAQPLMAWPGIPAVLDSTGGSSTGRLDATQQPMNLAVPAQTVGDALRLRPNLPVDSITDLILGLPGLFGGVTKSQVEWAEALQPTTILVWIGNNDALNAAIGGDPAAMTSEASFAADYTELLDRLAATGATLVVGNIPDVAVIPYVEPIPNVAAIFGAPPEVVAGALGVSTLDSLNLEGVVEAGAILQGQKAGPIAASFVLTPAEIAAIRDRTAKFNAVIAARAQAKGAIVVDTAALLNRWKAQGVDLPGKHLTTALYGGIFSLDGIHPTKDAAALTANEFISGLNSAGATIPPIAWLGVTRASENVSVQWTGTAAGYDLQTSDTMAANSWATVTTIASGTTGQSFATGAVKTFFRLRHD